jgi:hypothetical protein
MSVIYGGVEHYLRRSKILAIRGDAVMEATLGCKFEEIDDKNLMKGEHH